MRAVEQQLQAMSQETEKLFSDESIRLYGINDNKENSGKFLVNISVGGKGIPFRVY